MHGTVHRRAGFAEDTADPERFVAVLDKAYGASAMRQDQIGTQLIAEFAGDVSPQDGIIQVVKGLA